MTKKLLHEFEGVSAKAWKQKIQVDLAGADYNQTLVTKTLEGIDINPIYHADLAPEISPIKGQPDEWLITQAVFVDQEVVANKLVKQAINGGANSLWLKANGVFDYEKVFNDITLTNVVIFADFAFLSELFYTKLAAFLETKKARFHARIDLLHQLAVNGNWFENSKTDHQRLEAVCLAANRAQSILGVNMAHYANAGANAVQQLAYGLAHANEYLNHFGEQTQNIGITFTVASGSNYFIEIAKIRALRVLYKELAAVHGKDEQCTILASPGLRNKTIYDYNVNMLRTTTECMSAAIGGADAICNVPYDVVFHKSNEFGERISRNQLLVMKHEAYMSATTNPADGAYYIETLTQQLANKALDLFKSIEDAGGFLASLRAGTIQRKIKENAAQEQKAFDDGTLQLIGTNLFANEQEKLSETIALFPFVKKKSRKTLIEPIISKRLSETYEKTRLENEK
ncbi:MAG: methylmalonyl-CoA mutase subunit beta [Gilvibacter sp.]